MKMFKRTVFATVLGSTLICTPPAFANISDTQNATEQVQVSAVTLTADTEYVQMNAGEIFFLNYELSIKNTLGSALTVTTWEQLPLNGIDISSDNEGSYTATGTEKTVQISHLVNAPVGSTGTYDIVVGATVDGSIVEEKSIRVVVNADDDFDGVANDEDYCPDTAVGHAVMPNGCKPGEGPDANRFTLIELGGGDAPIQFRTLKANVSADQWFDNGAYGFAVSGTLMLSTPLGDVPMHEANVIFEQDAAGRVQRLRGTSRLPFPDLGVLKGIEVKRNSVAELGLDFGRNLAHLGAPLLDNRQYMFFHFADGFEASAGALSFSAPGNVETTMVFDHTDPFLYFKGDLPSAPGLPHLPSIGIGISAQGLIPFTPEVTEGIDKHVEPFLGHLYLSGSFPLVKIPVEIEGHMVGNFDPEKDGLDSPDFLYGANGAANVSFDLSELAGSKKKSKDKDGNDTGSNGQNGDQSNGQNNGDNDDKNRKDEEKSCDDGNLLKCFSINIPLGNMSLGLTLVEGEQLAYIAGDMEPDKSGLPFGESLLPSSNLLVSGLLSSDLPQSFIQAKGSYGFSVDELTKLVGVELGDLKSIEGELRLDKVGLTLNGTTYDGIHPSVAAGETRVALRMAGDPKDWYLRMNGGMSIAGVDLAGANLSIDHKGFLIDGKFVTPISEVSMFGKIDKHGINIGGHTAVYIPLGPSPEATEDALFGLNIAQGEVDKLNNEIAKVRKIVQGERDRDAKRLRTAQNAVTNAQRAVNSINSKIASNYRSISYHKRKIAARKRWAKKARWYQKAYRWGRYGAEASWRGAAIGGHYTAIGALKGSKFAAIGVLEGAKWTLKGFEEAAKTFPVDADPRLVGLFTAREGATLALNAAKFTLEELNKIPGGLAGDISLNIGTSGLSGEVSGDYCWNGSCKTLIGGRIKADPYPQACMTLVDEVCIGF